MDGLPDLRHERAWRGVAWRGAEYIAGWRSMCDLTPFGRGEEWEDSPTGWPQVPTHSWEI